eukprot:Skav217836  [mRNA]  locus=scaffold889:561567:568891:+ [translate_table: standard]
MVFSSRKTSQHHRHPPDKVEPGDPTVGTEVKTPQDQVCGAAFAAHWGTLAGNWLAFQVCQRFKLGRSTRSGLLKCLAERVANFHTMNREWEAFLQAMKEKHRELQKELQFQEKNLHDSTVKYDTSTLLGLNRMDAFQRSLASLTRRLLCEEEDYRLRALVKTGRMAGCVSSPELAWQVKRTIEEQQRKLVELEQQEDRPWCPSFQVRSKYSDLLAEDCTPLNRFCQETRERRLYQQAELLRQRRLEDDVMELNSLKVKLSRLQRSSRHLASLGGAIRQVANQDAKTLRTGGGYILNSMAKVEAQAFLRELRL